ncbi:bile acid:sodium symporter [Mycobacterium sp. UM_Kg1]|uniref:bile acid:sodium symporter family protein n=1 Tax=Mycobacterium sp. UM_Kg1 TaxID=1545691 RepID=UPI00061AA3F8|nr:bile acid:sodium symporter [Mycobacterium sp. UM_Kg1]
MDNRFFPLVVVTAMLALGMTLTVADFRRAAALKRPLAVALLCQALVLPALCLLIAEAFSLPAKLAIGLMLISAVPGGLLANVFSHLVNGDLALNLTLTAINAVLSIASLPAILAFSITWFTGEGRSIPLQLDKFVAVVGLVLIPTAIGVAIRERFPDLARRLKRPVRVAAAALLVAVSVAAIVGGRSTVANNLGALSGAVVTFCTVSLTVGYLVPRWMKLAPRQAIAISLEIGMHNAMVATAIALSPQLLDSAEISTVPALYGVIAPIIALLLVATVRRVDPAYRQDRRSPTDSADSVISGNRHLVTKGDTP